jgi:propanol-preferring alcohol dehydrogenase
MLLSDRGPIEGDPLHLRELPDPQPGPGEVLLRVRACAICRTDLHVVEGDLPGQRSPIIPGHQVVGEVVARGPGCARLREGQRVGVAWLRHACGACSACARGRENLCPQARFTGWHEHGGFAELTLVAEAFAYPLPDGFSDLEAAPLLCAGIVGYRALERAAAPPGAPIALWGFGSSAHVVIQLARHRGHEVFVVTRSPGHRELARALGAAWVGNRASDMPTKVASAIVFAPAGELVPTALEQLEPGGTLALAGVHMSRIPPLDYDRHLFYERDVRTVTASTRADGEGLLREAAQAGLRPRVTRFALAEGNRALQQLKQNRIDGSGVLVP